ncbi:YfiT family bacillithiol transferase [Fredinandcohnia sp. 179-A 10B2 NHS]|uniref:YfiT family bacillithiol transferase n=1 Tax=Fredinandcohnia sp. 179-A 10B2 NHS TaxID=3235176 RepID=UPI0039A239C6
MDERYPIGTFQFEGELSNIIIGQWINDIEALPASIRTAVKNLTDKQLDTPYRNGGWTIRQVVHHVPDSHMNAYIRFKWALTEDNPLIKPYDESKWAELSDYILPIEVSLTMLETVHTRFVKLLRNLTNEELQKTFIHPESGQTTLAKNIGMYAWHGNHHLAQITSLCKRMGWDK